MNDAGRKPKVQESQNAKNTQGWECASLQRCGRRVRLKKNESNESQRSGQLLNYLFFLLPGWWNFIKGTPPPQGTSFCGAYTLHMGLPGHQEPHQGIVPSVEVWED